MAEVFRGPIVRAVPPAPPSSLVARLPSSAVPFALQQTAHTLPVGQAMVAMPTPRPPAVDLRTWTPQPIILTTLASGPVPPPLRPLDWPIPSRKAQPVTPRHWRPTSAAPTARVPFPFGTVQDLPPRGTPYPVALRTFLKPLDGYLVPSQAEAAPFEQTEWPAPAGRGFPVELRTWLHTTDTQLTGLDVLPVRQNTWDVPSGRPFNRQLLTHTTPLSVTLASQDLFFGGNGQPPTYQPFPVPLARPSAMPERGWVASRLLPVLNTEALRPFVNVDWQLPQAAPVLVTRRGFIAFYVLDDSMPFAQVDWPRPLVTPVLRELRRWTDRPRIHLTSADVPANRLNDWPLPLAAPALRELRTYVRAPQVQLVGLDALPFRLNDWPLAQGKAFPLELRSWLQTTDQQFVERPPINLTAWPLPLGKTFPLERAWSFTQCRALAIIEPLPVRQALWPVPRGRGFPLLRLFIMGKNPAELPVPIVPPTDLGSRGGPIVDGSAPRHGPIVDGAGGRRGPITGGGRRGRW